MRRSIVPGAAMALVFAAGAASAAPTYTITAFTPIGTDPIGTGDGVSPSGAFATGYSQRSAAPAGSFAVLFNAGTGNGTNLPVLTAPARAFNQPYAVNDSGVVVGRGATTGFGSSPVPVIWQNGTAAQLPFPTGYNAGRAYGINNAGAVVGSIQGGAGLGERGFVYQNGVTTPIAATTAAGGTLTTAFGISSAGRIVGTVNDPANAALTHAAYLDPNSNTLQVIPDLDGLNSGIGFGVSSNGFVTGSNSFGGDGRAFLFRDGLPVTAIPLPPNTSSASGRAVNSSGWVVGTGGGQFAVPFLYDGVATYDLETLINDPTWDLNNNTSSGAFSIADNFTIVGRANHNGVLSGFVLTLAVPEPSALMAMVLPSGIVLGRRRR